MIMVQEHKLLITKHNAIAISIIGYVGVFAFFALIFLPFFTKGTSQVVSIICLTSLIILSRLINLEDVGAILDGGRKSARDQSGNRRVCVPRIEAGEHR